MRRPSPSPWRCRACGSSRTRLPCRRGKACGQSHSLPPGRGGGSCGRMAARSRRRSSRGAGSRRGSASCRARCTHVIPTAFTISPLPTRGGVAAAQPPPAGRGGPGPPGGARGAVPGACAPPQPPQLFEFRLCASADVAQAVAARRRRHAAAAKVAKEPHDRYGRVRPSHRRVRAATGHAK